MARRRPDTAARKRRRRAVEHHVREHGYWCPGYRRLAHSALDLTADHVDPRLGESGPLGVLCRSCNSRKRCRSPDDYGDAAPRHPNPLRDDHPPGV